MSDPPNHHRLTIRLAVANLPADESAAQYADRLTSELAEALDDAGRPVSHTESWVGSVYASVPADCPDCDARLEIDRPHLDSENGAVAHTRCPDEQCGWTGDAEYRLIDLIESDANDQPSPLVAEGRVNPTLQEYR